MPICRQCHSCYHCDDPNWLEGFGMCPKCHDEMKKAVVSLFEYMDGEPARRWPDQSGGQDLRSSMVCPPHTLGSES